MVFHLVILFKFDIIFQLCQGSGVSYVFIPWIEQFDSSGYLQKKYVICVTVLMIYIPKQIENIFKFNFHNPWYIPILEYALICQTLLLLYAF